MALTAATKGTVQIATPSEVPALQDEQPASLACLSAEAIPRSHLSVTIYHQIDLYRGKGLQGNYVYHPVETLHLARLDPRSRLAVDGGTGRTDQRVSSIVVLGSANMDLVVRQSRLPGPGETVFGTSLTRSPGGKGLNQAVAAARAGGQVIFLAAVGKDEFGEDLTRFLEGCNVDRSCVEGVPDATGTAIVTVTDDGENSIVVLAGANDARTSLDEPSLHAIGTAKYLVAQLERPARLVLEALAVARAGGAITVLTPAPVSRFDFEMFALVDILILNSGEALSLARVADPVEAAATLSNQVGMVVMTRGPLGVVVARHGMIVSSLPAPTVDPVDTTGAGDTFAGVLIARLAGGSPLNEALVGATAAASISVTRVGAASSIPTWDEVAALLAVER